MFAYYFDLALRSFRRNRVLTALMVLAIALGIGASMTTLTVFHVLSGDPIPQKSSKLFTVQLDPQSMDGYTPGEEPEDQMTRYDAEQLLREAKGDTPGADDRRRRGRAAGQAGPGAVRPGCALHVGGLLPDVRADRSSPATAGRKAQDDAHDRVAVITRKLAEKLFGTVQAVGKTRAHGRRRLPHRRRDGRLRARSRSSTTSTPIATAKPSRSTCPSPPRAISSWVATVR